MREKVWIERSAPQEIINNLIGTVTSNTLIARLLAARKITSVHEAQIFLSKSLKDLLDPLAFIDMDKAVARIGKAIISREHIGIFGDYDVDGVSSAALLEQFFLSVNARVSTTLPHRLKEGYGLSHAGIDRLKSEGATLLITADCGIVAHGPIDYARRCGFDVIVVDHHNPSDSLPNALAIINPKRADCGSKADYLCAAGVSFFLCIALRRHLRECNYFHINPEPNLRDLLDLVALATVCDVVPLIQYNRILVSAGLKVIHEGKRVGLKALISTSNVEVHKVSSTNLGFHLGPRINAAGRLEDATYALKLLREKDLVQAQSLSAYLESTNAERKVLESQTVDEASQIIDKFDPLPEAIILHNENWHPGVVGIVASRIVDRYHRPSIIIGTNGKGSGRSIKGIDLYSIVFKAALSLNGFGGHAHAIGLSLGPLGVDPFRKDVLAVMKEHVAPHIYKQEIFYDATLSFNQLSLSLVDELCCLEPYGAKNPYPLMRFNHCFMRNLRKLQGGHLKGELESSSGSASFIAFRMDIDDDLVSCPLDILAVVEKNEWQGRQSLQLRIIDYKKSR
jgi:single-stranded-DNA-specific exonuclease